MKWKRLQAIMAQLRSGRKHKITERDYRVLKHLARKKGLSSVPKLTTEFQTDTGSNISTTTVRWELHERGFHDQKAAQSLRSPCAMPSVGWSGVKLDTIGLWSSGNAFSGVMNHTSPSGCPTNKSVFGGCQENTTCLNV